MPAILTHDFFGRDAYADVFSRLGLLSVEEHDAFFLGNQGPDPLFYLVADPRVSKGNRVGGLMHHARPAKLLLSLHDALSMLTREERPVGEAYAAGFLCHYTLDRAMHPLVFFNEYAICDAGVDGLDRSDGGEVHAEIERDLDEMVLYTKTGKTVADYRPYEEVLHASDQTLAIIDKLYFYMGLWTYSRTLDLDCYTRAVKAFRLMQRLFYTPARARPASLRHWSASSATSATRSMAPWRIACGPRGPRPSTITTTMSGAIPSWRASRAPTASGTYTRTPWRRSSTTSRRSSRPRSTTRRACASPATSTFRACRLTRTTLMPASREGGAPAA